MPPISVYFLPQFLEPADLEEGVAVVIDVLRASTTIVHALAAGARAVIPCGEIDEARAVAADFPKENVVLGGERGGTQIPGFDLANTPTSYTPDSVGGRTVVFTTTNGTRALLRAATARRVFIGCFANLHSVLQLLLEEQRPVHLVCAGTDGQITLEDCLFAGALATGLRVASGDRSVPGDQTQMALALYETASRSADTFLATLRHSSGGANLVDLGLGADIDIAARWDTTDVVPELSRNPRQLLPALKTRPDVPRWLTPPGR